MFTIQAQQFSTAILIEKRQETSVNGAPKVIYVPASPHQDFCNFKSKGGTVSIQNGTLTVIDTAELEMWYRPDLTQKDRIRLVDNPDFFYDVLSPPENLENRGMFMKVKVKRAVNA